MLPGLVAGFQGFKFTHDLFGAGTVVPEIGFPGLFLKGGYLAGKSGVFKDASMYRIIFLSNR